MGELKVTVKRQVPVVRERWEMFLGHVATYVLCTSSADTNRRTAKAATVMSPDRSGGKARPGCRRANQVSQSASRSTSRAISPTGWFSVSTT
jgi:hypothetical protein